MQAAVEGGHPQLGQICYVPLYIMPQATAGGVDMASLQSCAAAMAGISNPFLSLQLPQASASSPSSSSPASPAVAQSLAQQAAAAAQQLAQGFPEYRLANFASLLPSAPHAQSPQTPQMAPTATAAQLAGLSQLAAAYPFQFSNGMLFSAAAAAAAGLSQQVPVGAEHHHPMSSPATGDEAVAGSSKKEIKFKYHMSIMPQLAVASNPPKVEIKKKRKPRMRITGRVCTHCGATKTTEWRMGPEGRGTLCNACGLRYRKKLLSDGQKDPNAKISMSMLLNATKKAGKPGGAKDGSEAGSGSPPRRSGEESP